MQVFYFDATLSKCKIYFLGAAILKFCLVFFSINFFGIKFKQSVLGVSQFQNQIKVINEHNSCLEYSFRQTFQDIPVALLHILTIGYIKHMVFVYLVLRLHIVL